MKFNIFNYSQKGAISLKLDLKDLLILDWFQTFQPRMSKIIHENEQYYWVSYEKVLEDIPILEITTAKGLYKRLQNLCEVGILKHYTKTTNAGSYSYYLITDMIKILISSESSFASSESSFASSQSSVHNNSSIINSSIIDKKAIASCGLSSQKNIDATQEKSNEVLEDVISLEEFRDLWLEIKGDVNLDKVEQKYERCVIFYNKKKSKTGIKNYAKEFISKEDERFSNNKDMPLKPPVSQKEAQQEVVEYKEPQVIEIPFKKEFAEVYEEVEKAVDSNFLFNHYISCAVADINDDKITIYNKGYLDKKAVEKAEQRASSMIKEKISKHLDRLKKEDALKNYWANMKFAKNDEKRGKALVSYFKELLKEPNIAIEFVYKKAIRVIND
jgi:hypothetical protein